MLKTRQKPKPIRSLGATICQRIEELATITAEAGKLTRIYLTPEHRASADRVMRWMEEAGMAARMDATGTVIGRYEGSKLGARALLLGSHIDTVRDGGKYDGSLGVLAPIAVVERLHKAKKRLPFAIEVVAFGDEEGVRFPTTLGGSRAMAGVFDAKTLDETDAQGITRRQALLEFGCDPKRIPKEARDPKKTLGYVELHIEQGPVLEKENLPLAVVTAINGATRGVVTVRGVGGHAGTVPMALRNDALTASAEMVLAIERRGRGNPDLVATVGRLEIANAATNTVPGEVAFTLDVRSPSDAQRKAAIRTIADDIAAIAKARGVEANVAYSYDAPAAAADSGLSEQLADAMQHLQIKLRHLPSGAGHDAMAFRGRMPFAMLFVRCRGGISHNPAEYTSPADIDTAARVLEQFVLNFRS